MRGREAIARRLNRRFTKIISLNHNLVKVRRTDSQRVRINRKINPLANPRRKTINAIESESVGTGRLLLHARRSNLPRFVVSYNVQGKGLMILGDVGTEWAANPVVRSDLVVSHFL